MPTLFPSGLDLTALQADRLDAYSTEVWLDAYRDLHGGDDPPDWPDPAGHLALAEWAIKRVMRREVMTFEADQARQAVVSDEW